MKFGLQIESVFPWYLFTQFQHEFNFSLINEAARVDEEAPIVYENGEVASGPILYQNLAFYQYIYRYTFLNKLVIKHCCSRPMESLWRTMQKLFKSQLFPKFQDLIR